MARNRWVRPDTTWRPATGGAGPLLPSLEAVYLTDPDILAAVIPPPLRTPPEPRVHVRVTDIDLEMPGGHRHHEMVGYIAVDAVHDGAAGVMAALAGDAIRFVGLDEATAGIKMVPKDLLHVARSLLV